MKNKAEYTEKKMTSHLKRIIGRTITFAVKNRYEDLPAKKITHRVALPMAVDEKYSRLAE